MTLPADQRLLYDDLVIKLSGLSSEEGLVAYMGEVLRTLLRRKGDAEFLSAIQDAFTDGIAGRPWPEQKMLAGEIVRVVIEKRPEIARAWQALYGQRDPAPYQRRETDRAEAPAPPPAKIREPAAAPPPEEPDEGEKEAPYEFATSEELVAHYVAEVLHQRLGIFRVPAAGFPSASYCHDRPFFLFTPEFAEVAEKFVVGPLLQSCRLGLERRVYRHARPEVLADADKRKAFLTEKRPEVWKIFTERLTKLAAAQKNAEAKVALAAAGEGEGGSGFKMVEVPVSRPKVYRILGVEFTLGRETTTRKVKVKAKSPTELDKGELEALEMIGCLRDMAAQIGFELPPSADFQFLRTLFEFDAKRFAMTTKEFSKLAGHKETTRQYLFERLDYIDKTYSNYLSDILVVMLFYEHGNGRFGFQEFYDVCAGTAREKSAVASKRPFVQLEVGRRPRELAFQLREALRRRLSEDAVMAAVEMLLDAFETMARKRFRNELEAALTVLGAFPLVFAGDPDEAAFSAIGHTVHDALTAKTLDRKACLNAVYEAYGVAARRRAAG